jgi:hypothetical protein
MSTSYEWDDPRRLGLVAYRPAECGLRSWDERFPPLSPERERQIMASVKPPRAVKAPARNPHTYLVGAEGSPLVKIGYTKGDPKKRLASLQTGQPMALSLLWAAPGDYEHALHQRFAEHRVRGEWFDLTPFGDPCEAVQAAVEELQSQPRPSPADTHSDSLRLPQTTRSSGSV